MYLARTDVKVTAAQRRSVLEALRRASKSPTYDLSHAAKQALVQIEGAGG